MKVTPETKKDVWTGEEVLNLAPGTLVHTTLDGYAVVGRACDGTKLLLFLESGTCIHKPTKSYSIVTHALSVEN